MDKSKVRKHRATRTASVGRHDASPAPQGGDTEGQLAPLRILIVEDEMLLAMLLEAVAAESGHTSRKASRLSKAIELANAESFDVAVLDVNLAGERVFPLAALLRERGVPFLFASGYGEAGLPTEYCDCLVLQKPYSADDFNSALRALLRDSGSEGARRE